MISKEKSVELAKKIIDHSTKNGLPMKKKGNKK